MTETTPPTEQEALAHLLASFDYDLALEVLKGADMASNHFDTRSRLARLLTVISLEFPAIAARYAALVAENEPAEPTDPEA